MLILLMNLISRLINRSGLRISHSKVFISELETFLLWSFVNLQINLILIRNPACGNCTLKLRNYAMILKLKLPAVVTIIITKKLRKNYYFSFVGNRKYFVPCTWIRQNCFSRKTSASLSFFIKRKNIFGYFFSDKNE